MIIRVAGIVEDSIVDGPGLRLTVFAQGCSRRCPGCHNPDTWDYSGGTEIDTGEILEMMSANPLLDGLSLSGGEPFDQAVAFAELAGGARERGYHVMAWSGYTFEELAKDDTRRKLLETVDILVDGPFMLEQRSLNLPWRGSKNQRVLDAARSLTENHPVAAALAQLTKL